MATSIRSQRYSFLSSVCRQMSISKTGIILRSASAVNRLINNFIMNQAVATQFEMEDSQITDCLEIVKNFLLETHQQLNEELDYPEISQSTLHVIDQASVKLKTNKEQISILEKQLKETQMNKANLKEIKSDNAQLEKRVNQKCDEISILRQTIKTLYADNQKMAIDKEQLSKQLIAAKQSCNSMKKKLKRQEQQMSNHKSELKKLTAVAEERLSEYAQEDEQKQQTIKKLNSEIQRLRADAMKKEKALAQQSRKNEQNKSLESDYNHCLSVVDSMKYENSLLKTEIQSLKAKSYQQKTKLVEQNEQLLKELEISNQKADKLSLAAKEAELSLQCAADKNRDYEGEIVMRTQKLKEKTRQINSYSDEISKLVKRVEEISKVLEEIMEENKELADKNQGLEERLSELRALQVYMGKIKGDLSHKKSMELNKLFETLGKLQTSS